MNLGKKITKAIKENEKLDEQHIWDEIKESDKSMYILSLPFTSTDGMKGAPLQWDFQFPEKEKEQK